MPHDAITCPGYGEQCPDGPFHGRLIDAMEQDLNAGPLPVPAGEEGSLPCGCSYRPGTLISYNPRSGYFNCPDGHAFGGFGSGYIQPI